MDEQRGISSGVSSEPGSNSGLLSEKRIGNGLEENQELGSKRIKAGDLDSDTKTSNLQSDKDIGIVQQPNLSIKASTVLQTTTCVPKTLSISKDDDRPVVSSGKQALPDNPTVKYDSNCEPRAAESRDLPLTSPVSEKSGPFQMGNAVDSLSSKSDSMRRWMEMKRNGFLSGPLGGVAAPSTAVAAAPVEVPAQKQQKNKRRTDSVKKKNEVPKKEQQQVDRFLNVTGPSGLLTEFNPGIITNIRSKEQVYSIIENLIRNATDAAPTGQRHVSLNAGDAVREDMGLAFKLPSTWVYDDPNSITNPEQATSLAVEAATVASQWLGFLHQDLVGRLSAVQDSKNRVQSILNTELPLLVSSRESSSNQESSLQMMDTNTTDDKTVPEMHQTKWFEKFGQINKDLDDEERDLERSLNQVKEMQSRCNEGLTQMEEYSSFGKDWNQESSMEVQAAAASIFSTCSYLLSMMKPPPPTTSS